MLSAGTNVEWLRDDLGLIATAEESEKVAAVGRLHRRGRRTCRPCSVSARPTGTTAPAARCSGSPAAPSRPHRPRRCSKGVAERGADLVEAIEADCDLSLGSLRVDGGMSKNGFFTQRLADATQRPVEVCPVREATTLGAGFLAGLAVGTWGGWDDLASSWRPARVIEPGAPTDRDRWAEAVRRSTRWHEDLSGIDF